MDHDPPSVQQESEQRNDRLAQNLDSGADGGSNTGFALGSMVGGRYKILAEIGRGGMGIVYKVEQVFLREVYAFKLLQEQHLQGNSLVRFQTEAQATNRFNNRNLVSCKDFGLLEDNRPFLVMEHIHGVTLEETLKRRGALPIKEAVEIFLQVCDGMAYAHDHGIIHRDLKPSNIMLPEKPFDTRCDVVKILDFGIAKIVCDEDRQSVTRTGEIFGSPYYMSPEQCLGKNIDLRSDVYALGCVFFEALTGLPPYSAETALATMMQHQSNTIPTLKQASLGGAFPQALEQVVARLLAKDPAHRYQSMMAVKHDLQRVLEDKDIQWNAVEPSGARQNFDVKKASLIGVSLALIVCFLVAMALTKPAPMNNIPASVTAKDSKPTRPSLDDLLPYPEDKYYAAIPLQQAKSKKGPWILKFPNESLGKVSLPPFAGTDTDGHKAQGTVQFSVPYALVFTPSWTACDKPKNFRRFRSDELYSVDLSNMIDISDDLLISFDHLTGLRGLSLLSTDISDKGLAHVENLPNLKDLRVSDSKVTGAGLAKLKCIKHVEQLWIDQTDNLQPVLKALDGSSAIRYLSAKHDALTDADMKYISHLPNLTTLHLSHNPITDAGLAKLSRLKNLDSMYVTHCNLTPASIPVLESFPHMQYLYVTTANWPEDKKQELRRGYHGRELAESSPRALEQPDQAERSKK